MLARICFQSLTTLPGNRLFTMHKNWCGDTSAIKIRAFNAPGMNMNIHRLKVDEGYNFLITTHARPGGLTVKDLATESVLWELPGVRDWHNIIPPLSDVELRFCRPMFAALRIVNITRAFSSLTVENPKKSGAMSLTMTKKLPNLFHSDLTMLNDKPELVS